MIAEAYLFFLSTELRANQAKIRLPQLAPTLTLHQTNSVNFKGLLGIFSFKYNKFKS